MVLTTCPAVVIDVLGYAVQQPPCRATTGSQQRPLATALVKRTNIGQRLLASFQRITGKSFGKIPMNPILLSDTRTIAASEKRYRELLDAWAQWWAWEPGK